jgi:hypothetical protein
MERSTLEQYRYLYDKLNSDTEMLTQIYPEKSYIKQIENWVNPTWVYAGLVLAGVLFLWFYCRVGSKAQLVHRVNTVPSVVIDKKKEEEEET